jgi:hypothetical protein
MGGACSRHGSDEKCVQNFGRKTNNRGFNNTFQEITLLHYEKGV